MQAFSDVLIFYLSDITVDLFFLYFFCVKLFIDFFLCQTKPNLFMFNFCMFGSHLPLLIVA